MKTLRTCTKAPGRLFPAIEFETGWRLSLQADAAGYACFPRRRLDVLEEYERVEAIVYGPFPHPVDVATLDLPAALLAKFTPLDRYSGVMIGCEITHEEIVTLIDAIRAAETDPNAGIPTGYIAWRGNKIHLRVADETQASDIVDRGLSMLVAQDGPLGRAIYARGTPEGGAGVPVVLRVGERANVLDLRNAVDRARWSSLGLDTNEPGVAMRARSLDISGVFHPTAGFVIFDERRFYADA